MVKYQWDGKVAPECDDADEQRWKIGGKFNDKKWNIKWKTLRNIKLLRFPPKKQRRFSFLESKSGSESLSPLQSELESVKTVDVLMYFFNIFSLNLCLQSSENAWG